jgi:hypothetical protein
MNIRKMPQDLAADEYDEVLQTNLRSAFLCSKAVYPAMKKEGGGKIILPGVSHIDTIAYNHGKLIQEHPRSVGVGKIEGNVPRLDIEEATRMAGLDVKIDAILNLRAEITGLFIGDPILEHQEGTKLAKEVYVTTPAKDMDVVVVNAFSKPNECAIAPFIFTFCSKDHLSNAPVEGLKTPDIRILVSGTGSLPRRAAPDIPAVERDGKVPGDGDGFIVGIRGHPDAAGCE